MVLAKNSFLPNIKSLKIPKNRLVIGILIGLAFSFIFYSFLYLTREVLRIFSVFLNNDLWILNDKEVNFYNLFFSYISVIIGQSVCFTYWIERPKRFFSKQNYRIKSIVNDQRNLNWYFICWFSKLAVIFWILFGMTFSAGHYVFSLYPAYNYVFIIIIIVLFLQSWSSIRRAFPRHSLKWMFVAALVVSGISFGMSKINIIDYKAINKGHLKNDVFYNYKLELPETDYYEKLYKRSLIENIYLVESNDKEKRNIPIVLVNHQKISFERLSGKIIELQSMYDEYARHQVVYKLYIHNEVKMVFVNNLKEILSGIGVSNIAYAVIPTRREYDKRYYKDYAIKMRIPAKTNPSLVYAVGFPEPTTSNNTIEIKSIKNGHCLINGKAVEIMKLKDEIKRQILRDTNYSIKVYSNRNIMFKDYSKLLFAAKQAIVEVRNEYALEIYVKQFNRLNIEQEDSIRAVFPMWIWEHVENTVNP